MADISQEVEAFRNAKKGRDVRGSMISLAEKVNADGENALSQVGQQVTRIDGIAAEATQSLNDANTAIDTANTAINEAQTTLATGAQQVQAAAESATESKSWSLDSKTEADRAKNQADRAEAYAGIILPQFMINFATGNMEHTDTTDMLWLINTTSGNMEYNYV